MNNKEDQPQNPFVIPKRVKELINKAIETPLFVQGKDPELHQASSQVFTRDQISRRENLTELRGDYKDIELPSRAKSVPKSKPARSFNECREADKRREETEAKIRANWAEDDANNF